MTKSVIRRASTVSTMSCRPIPRGAEGPASGAKVAMFALAIAVVLGAVFYGLNNTTVNNAGTSPPSQTAQQTQPANPTAPPGMRDVTPRGNNQPGTTTVGVTARRGRHSPSTDMNKGPRRQPIRRRPASSNIRLSERARSGPSGPLLFSCHRAHRAL